MAKTGEIGNLYGKPDIERLGLFSEMPYMNGKGYVSLFPKPRVNKGRNIMGEGPKVKTGKQDCYFDKEFKRLFVGEALKGRGMKKAPKVKNVSEKPFVPAGETKLHSTPGDHYGTFGGRIEAFGNLRRPKPPYKREPRNAVTSLGKQGGYGYANICLSPYPTHDADRYGAKPKYKMYGRVLDGPMLTNHYPQPYFERNPFKDPPDIKPGPTYVRPQEKTLPPLPPGKLVPTGPAKLPGGCHAGCFDKFPEYKPDKYLTLYEVLKPKKRTGGKFYPQSTAEKTFYTCSVINENLRFRVNAKNHGSFEPTYIKYLVD
ncbi:cilia-and flagella-associated protein 96 [Leptinotarsa decemlineata]|uniref:cilia-and flagella-associated protein 96 n=1 Tax=Leptinotarsa decemlineata TaxID=7539 RepID=UPI000C2555B5|nr:UPF0602 protein C4orf47-like [Leptinotarsa decemlineata]